MRMTSAVLEKVRKNDLCTGCGACAALTDGKAEMIVERGYNRPRQRAAFSDAQEAAIGAVCPGLGLRSDCGPDDDATARTQDVLWGPIVQLWEGWAQDPRIRHQGSSGGVLTAILKHLLSTGAVAFVVETAADDMTPYANKAIATRDADTVFDAAGSRYAPSSPLANLETHLARKEPFAFVGKPCDIAALRAMAVHDPRIDRLIPYKLSFFCAGVPSLDGARAILDAMGVDDAADVAQFRYRGDGWPGTASATLKNGDKKQMSYHESWGEILTQHLQFRCKICPDGVGGAADLVCADAWSCDDKGYPTFDERDGVSLILARTPAGARLADAVAAAGVIHRQPADLKRVNAMQPGQVKRKRLAWSRLAAIAVVGVFTGAIRPKFSQFQLRAAAMQAGMFANVKSFLGMCRRLVLAAR